MLYYVLETTSTTTLLIQNDYMLRSLEDSSRQSLNFTDLSVMIFFRANQGRCVFSG